MTVISNDALRKLVEWARNNGKVTQEAGGGVRFEHEGKTYVVPAELLASAATSPDQDVDLTAYAVRA